jgi:cytidylate kinase/small subunit ribosomal protein S1
MSAFRVAIDGPAGSGKSTISQIIAKKLGFTHIDTGALYRAVTLEAIKRKIDLNCEAQYDFLATTDISYHNNVIYINGEDVSKQIRSKEVTENVSLVASFNSVRTAMVALSKRLIQTGLVVMDGRDIGTVVIPDAELKIFLTANLEERAKRRQNQITKTGAHPALETIIENIKKRDQKDSQRELSPLKKADDAVEIDTSNLSLDETADLIISLINEKKEAINHGKF